MATTMSVSSSGSTSGQFTLSPVPTTTATSSSDGQCASLRIPASLRSKHTTSFGHFTFGANPAISSTASVTATAMASDVSAAARGGGCTSTENSSDAPGGATKERP